MNQFQFLFKTFKHYFARNLLVAIGVSICTAVITGGLIIGNSVRHSLEQNIFFRLGNITHVAMVTDRYFRSGLAHDLHQKTGHAVAPALILQGIAITDGGQQRINNVQIIGVDESFSEVTGVEHSILTLDNEVIISENMALRLGVKSGDAIMLRIEKASLFPKNAPFVSETEPITTIRTIVKAIAGNDEMGRFNLKNSQSAPYNLFISLARLNRLMEFEGRANHLLFSVETEQTPSLYAALNTAITPADGGLIIKEIPLTGEVEISSERVFLENSVVNAYRQFADVRLILTYFVNSMNLNGNKTPYSFVASMSQEVLDDDEIIINEWIAGDLNARIGDTIRLAYFEIGPLRQLIEKDIELKVKRIVPIKGIWADGDLMPNLPGISDAGHCRDWEAGVPINLNNIRQKDEDYWSKYKGIPKAFVSDGLAQKIWTNRFGSYTAIRFPASGYIKSNINRLFSENIQPVNLGFAIQAVRDDGLKAARGGVDFSQLFIGLSFFLLLAAIILTALLFRLNLETRSTQLGTLLQLGFRQKQIARLFFAEGALIALTGIIFGLLLAIIFAQIVFFFLNSLWWDIVRTNVLIIMVEPVTIITGAIISLVIGCIAIVIPLYRYLKKSVSQLHRSEVNGPKPRLQPLRLIATWAMLILALALLVWQFFVISTHNPVVFFIAGGLLLFGLILLTGFWLKKSANISPNHFSLTGISLINIARNRGQSLTVILLFALGTFLVVSTGANRKDMFSGAREKSGGTGGFRYFAQTSVPVLFDLNDAQRRTLEGLPDSFTIVQFHRIDGDDASCLNLNRISNPAILGVDADKLSGRFTFATQTADLDKNNPWKSLNKTLEGGIVPAIADQTVIQWGLGMEVGDTLKYQNETGDTLKIKLIGGLSPSVFQGYIIIANQNFLNNYPTHSGSSVFLIHSEDDDTEDIGTELQNQFRDYGWEMTSAPQRLAEFYSVTNTYLSIFLALGALGLILGTIGLAVVLARSIIERRSELAVMQAIGFRKRTIINMLVQEYGLLLLLGVGIGFVAAVVATLPAIISDNAPISFLTIALVGTIILVNGFAWIIMLAATLVKPAILTGALKDE